MMLSIPCNSLKNSVEKLCVFKAVGFQRSFEFIVYLQLFVKRSFVLIVYINSSILISIQIYTSVIITIQPPGGSTCLSRVGFPEYLDVVKSGSWPSSRKRQRRRFLMLIDVATHSGEFLSRGVIVVSRHLANESKHAPPFKHQVPVLNVEAMEIFVSSVVSTSTEIPILLFRPHRRTVPEIIRLRPASLCCFCIQDLSEDGAES